MRIQKLQFGLSALLLTILGFAVLANWLVAYPKIVQPYIEVIKGQDFDGARYIAVKVTFADSSRESYESRWHPKHDPDFGVLDYFVVSKNETFHKFMRPNPRATSDELGIKDITPRMVETYSLLRKFVALNSRIESISWAECETKQVDGKTVGQPYKVRIPLTKDFQRAVPKGELEGL